MKSLFCTLLIVVSTQLTAQVRQTKIILVVRNNIIARYQEGEDIRFQRKGNDYFSYGTITGIHQEYFKIGEADTVYLRQIRRIDLHNKSNTNFNLSGAGQKLIAAGVILYLADGIAHDFSSVSPGIITVSVAFVGVGMFTQFFNNNFYKIGRRKKVAIVEF